MKQWPSLHPQGCAKIWCMRSGQQYRSLTRHFSHGENVCQPLGQLIWRFRQWRGCHASGTETSASLWKRLLLKEHKTAVIPACVRIQLHIKCVSRKRRKLKRNLKLFQDWCWAILSLVSLELGLMRESISSIVTIFSRLFLKVFTLVSGMGNNNNNQPNKQKPCFLLH